MRTGRGLKVFQVLAGGAWGGGSVVVLAISKALIDQGCQVWVLSQDEVTTRRYAEAGVRVVTSPYWRREISPRHDLMLLFDLFRICRRERFDVVNTHTSKVGIAGRIAARLAGVPRVIHTAQGFAFNETDSRATASFYRYLEKLATYFCDLVISVNEEERRIAIEKGVVSPDKIVTVYNGVDTRPFQRARASDRLRAEILGAPEGLLVGVTARLMPQKGLEYLIRAIPLVVRDHPQMRFAFAGSGPLESELKNLAADLGVSDHCRFLGFRKDIPELLASFDIYVLPSLWEGFSLSLLEAMAAGKPVVTTDIKGSRELVEDGVDGLLVEPANPTALAGALLELADDMVRARAMGEKARRKVERYYSEAAMVRQTLKLYGLEPSEHVSLPLPQSVA